MACHISMGDTSGGGVHRSPPASLQGNGALAEAAPLGPHCSAPCLAWLWGILSAVLGRDVRLDTKTCPEGANVPVHVAKGGRDTAGCGLLLVGGGAACAYVRARVRGWFIRLKAVKQSLHIKDYMQSV